MKTLRVLSAVLAYPTGDLQAAAGEMTAALTAEAVLPKRERAALAALLCELAADDLYDLQERWLLLFDRTRSLSLHLFEHVHGESRDRGQAMVDLLAVYFEGGFEPVSGELPDFLPLFLEFASTRKPEEALELARQPGPIYAALEERLVKRNSPYAAAMAALSALTDARLDVETIEALLAEPESDPDDLAALDAAWEEEEVLFGPAALADACGRDGLATRLRHASRPAPGVDRPEPGGTRFTHSGQPLDRGA